MNEVEIIAARDDVSPSLRNEMEYKLPVLDNSSSNAIAHFYVEYCNGRKPEFRKCMICGERLNVQTLVQVLFIVITICAPKTLSENHQVKSVSKNFRPTSADTERVFSLAKISKNNFAKSHVISTIITAMFL